MAKVMYIEVRNHVKCVSQRKKEILNLKHAAEILKSHLQQS